MRIKKKTKQKVPIKRFIVKKYIMAQSAQEAIRLEKKVRPDDVWVDEDWKKDNPNQLLSAIGFTIQTESDYEN